MYHRFPFRFLFSRFRQPFLLRATLLSVGLLDEIIAGFPVIALPLIRDQLGLSYTQIGLLFGIAGVVTMMLEPAINLLSDHGSKRSWIIVSALIGAAGYVLAGNAWNFALLLLAFVITGPATSATVGLSQAALIDQNPHDSTQAMTRWTLLGSIGDFLAPIVITFVVSLKQGWPALCWITTAVWLWIALALCVQRVPRTATTRSEDETPKVTLLGGLREALRDPVMLRWAALSIVPTMLDEIFLGFVALYLHDVLHANQATIDLVILIGMIGSMVSLLALDRVAFLRKVAPRQFMIGSALVVLVGVVGLLSLRSIWLAAAALLLIHLGGAGCYPVAKAQAYARLPGRSGTVLAITNLGAPFEVALPGIVGWVAGSFGIVAGLGVLGLAPLFILLLACSVPKSNPENK